MQMAGQQLKAGQACLHRRQPMSSFTGLRASRPCTEFGGCSQRKVAQQQRMQTVSMSAVSAPATLEVKSLEGSSLGTESLALKVADKETAKGLVHRYLVMVRQNARRGTASTLTRAEVAGGGRKPYKQKGTGNARMGSRRSPLVPGGGVTFGPKPRDFTIRMNKKERRLALATAFQSAAPSITVVEDLKDKFTVIKTKAFVAALKAWGVEEKEHTLLILNEDTEAIAYSTRNLPNLKTNLGTGLQVYDILRADKIIIEASALKYVQEFYSGSYVRPAAVAAEAEFEPVAEVAAETESA